MTAVKVLRFLHLVVYLVLTSQLAYYLFVMGDAMKMVSIGNFVEQRKIVDPLVHQRHVPFYYACLALSLALLVVLRSQWQTPGFIAVSIATVLLLADVILGLKLNGPINETINRAIIGDPSIDWESLRIKWIDFIRLRAVLSFAGFATLLAALVFWRK